MLSGEFGKDISSDRIYRIMDTIVAKKDAIQKKIFEKRQQYCDNEIDLCHIKSGKPHTRTRHTKKSVKSAPKKKTERKSYRFEEVFKKDLEKNGEAGVALWGLRAREGLTQKELAKRIKVSQHHISEMENKKRVIGRDIAQRLEKEFNVSYKVFL